MTNSSNRQWIDQRRGTDCGVYLASSEKNITRLDELERIGEERGIANCKVPARHSNAMTEKYHEKLRQDSRWPGRH
jgi:hypothetical protein